VADDFFDSPILGGGGGGYKSPIFQNSIRGSISFPFPKKFLYNFYIKVFHEKNFPTLINTRTHPRNLGFQKRIFRENLKNPIFRGNTVLKFWNLKLTIIRSHEVDWKKQNMHIHPFLNQS